MIHWLPQGPVHVSESALTEDGLYLGKLVLVHDMSFIEHRSADTKRYIIILFTLLAVVISLITVFVAHLSWRGWIKAMKGILRGEIGPRRKQQSTPPEIRPLEGDLRRCYMNSMWNAEASDDVDATVDAGKTAHAAARGTGRR